MLYDVLWCVALLSVALIDGSFLCVLYIKRREEKRKFVNEKKIIEWFRNEGIFRGKGTPHIIFSNTYEYVYGTMNERNQCTSDILIFSLMENKYGLRIDKFGTAGDERNMVSPLTNIKLNGKGKYVTGVASYKDLGAYPLSSILKTV